MDNNSDYVLKVKVKKVIPTHVGQKCPVCNGYGTVAHFSKTCGSCEGKGYILVPAKEANNEPAA